MREFKKKKIDLKRWPVAIAMIGLIVLLFFYFFIMNWATFPYSRINAVNKHFSDVGSIPLYTEYARIDFSYIDSVATREKEDKVIMGLPLVFVANSKISSKVLDDFTTFEKIFFSSREGSNSASDINAALLKKVSTKIDIKLIDELLKSENIHLVFDKTMSALKSIYTNYIFSVNESNLLINEIKIVLKNSEQQMIKQGEFLYSDESNHLFPNSAVALELEKIKTAISATDLYNIGRILQSFVVPNTFFSNEFSQRYRKHILGQLEPVKVEIKKGDLLFSEGQPITKEQHDILVQLNSFHARISVNKIIFLFLYLTLLALMAYSFFRRPFVSTYCSNKELIVPIVVVAIGVVYSFICQLILPDLFSSLSWFLVVPLIVIVVSIIVNVNVGFFTGFLFSLLQPLTLIFYWYTDMGFLFQVVNLFFFAIIPALVAAYFVQKISCLFDYLKVGFCVTLFSLLCALGYSVIFYQFSIYSLFFLLAIVGVNGFVISLIAPSLVLLFDRLFNLPTIHRLVDLANTSLPIFQQMASKAPGTYIHSMAVANLAEAACHEVGGNGMLARVGAYYHDIGKIDQPEYFTENQHYENKHDDIKPMLSVSVIKSHVTKGVEKATQLKLPKEVIDIIEQHHGTSVIQYFYLQALNEANTKTVVSSDYCYTTPVPNSIESAIVMLADCTEASCRSLKNPTLMELEAFIWKIMLEKLTSGQLMQVDLSFKQLEQIRQVFTKLIYGQYHTRISYQELLKKNQDSAIIKELTDKKSKESKTLSIKKEKKKSIKE